MTTLPDVETILIEPDPSFNIRRPLQKNGKLTVGRAGMIALMGRYLEAQMDIGVSLLELHKLMYFFQECGEPLRPRFKKGLYGPHAENLPHVLDVMNNVHIKGFDNRENAPDKMIDIIDNAYGKAIDFLKDNSAIMQRIEKVADLIAGFETPFGLELLSTVYWVSKNENAKTVENAIEKTHEWNSRKKMFDNHHITVAWNQLKEKICS